MVLVSASKFSLHVTVARAPILVLPGTTKVTLPSGIAGGGGHAVAYKQTHKQELGTRTVSKKVVGAKFE